MTETGRSRSWHDTIAALREPKVFAMLFLGFSAGIPILLIFSSLSLWLREAGVERATVTYFSWAALGYSFKFVWAPLVDKLPLPWLTKCLGRRRAWLGLSQIMIIIAILLIAAIDPVTDSLVLMAMAAVLLGFSSATQDIVIDAYRIEAAQADLQALMSSTYIAGYRIAMLLAGAGALYLADLFGSTAQHYDYFAWQQTYWIMAGFMVVGLITTYIIDEPAQSHQQRPYTNNEYGRFLSLFFLAVCGFVASFYFSADMASQFKSQLSQLWSNGPIASFAIESLRLLSAFLVAALIAILLIKTGIVSQQMVSTTYVDPITDFFQRYGWGLAWLLLGLIGLYRISDIVLGVISNVFYYDLGFTKSEIATVVKTFGVIMSVVGALVGGVLTVRHGVMKMLMLGAILSALTNLLFMLLAQVSNNMTLFVVVVAADNMAAGFASAAFIAFLSGLTNVSFTAMQYAIFSSLMTLLPKLLGGYSGAMVDSIGYPTFFLITAIMGIPVLVLIALAKRYLVLEQEQK